MIGRVALSNAFQVMFRLRDVELMWCPKKLPPHLRGGGTPFAKVESAQMHTQVLLLCFFRKVEATTHTGGSA